MALLWKPRLSRPRLEQSRAAGARAGSDRPFGLPHGLPLACGAEHADGARRAGILCEIQVG